MKRNKRIHDKKLTLGLTAASLVCGVLILIHFTDAFKAKENIIANRAEAWEFILIGEEEKAAAPIPATATTTIPILVYHKFRSNHATSTQTALAKAYSVDENVFDEQLRFLQDEHYTVLTMRELLFDEENHRLPSKPVVLTFDDGWKSQYTVALPLLEKHHMRGTFYIYTGVVGSHAFMDWQELKDLVDKGMEIGGHTKSHPRLAKLNPNGLAEELLGSKQLLEKNLNVTVTDLAYPYGSYDDAVIQAAKEYGYLSGRTSNHGLYNDFKDPYRLNVLYAPKTTEELAKLLR